VQLIVAMTDCIFIMSFVFWACRNLSQVPAMLNFYDLVSYLEHWETKPCFAHFIPHHSVLIPCLKLFYITIKLSYIDKGHKFSYWYGYGAW